MAGKPKKPTIETFIDDHAFEKIQSNCYGGLIENYIMMKANDGGSKNKAKLVQSIDMSSASGKSSKDALTMINAEHKIALAMDLDPEAGKCVDCMNEYYMSDNRVFVVNDFTG